PGTPIVARSAPDSRRPRLLASAVVEGVMRASMPRSRGGWPARWPPVAAGQSDQGTRAGSVIVSLAGSAPTRCAVGWDFGGSPRRMLRKCLLEVCWERIVVDRLDRTEQVAQADLLPLGGARIEHPRVFGRRAGRRSLIQLGLDDGLEALWLVV